MGGQAVLALVEVPKGSRNKYEYDETAGQLRIDGVLDSPPHYPAHHGFIVGTLADNADHLAALIVAYEPTFPWCLIAVCPVGVLDMRDEKVRDQKFLAVPTVDPRFAEVADLPHLPRLFLSEIEHFFQG